MTFRSFLLLLLIGVSASENVDDLVIAAPSSLGLNSDESIAIVLEGRNVGLTNASVSVYEHPAGRKIIFEDSVSLHTGESTITTIRLNSEEFTPGFLDDPGSPKFVSLRVKAPLFERNLVIPISEKAGYVFIQTDKPIYTPKQEVRMRIITLNEEGLPSDEIVKLQIKNPNENIVEEKVFIPMKEKEKKPFVTHTYEFPLYPVLGKWSAVVFYGYKFQQNSTVHFDLEEYVLPTFKVSLKSQDVILPSTETIKINVLAKYIYGKKVEGLVTFRLGVKGRRPEITFLDDIGPKELEDGGFELSFNMDDLKNNKDIGWFPDIKGSRLVIEASVVDVATGIREVAIDSKGRFATSPFKISFQRCLKDFKPGYITVFEADVNHVDGSPAAGVPTTITALADMQPVNIVQSTAVSDRSGKIGFEIQTELSHNKIFVRIETTDPRYVGSQASGIFLQQRSMFPGSAYIAIERGIKQRLQLGDMFRRIINYEPSGIKEIYYVVAARRRILDMKRLPPGEYKTQRVEFEITPEMIPSFRIVVIAPFRNKLLADSLKIDVERSCNPKAQVSITPDFSVKESGTPGKFVIEGSRATFVGMLGVDEAVYALSKQDLLTNSKIFNKFETHDLGCGPGGGVNIPKILSDAGVALQSRVSSPYCDGHFCEYIKTNRRYLPLIAFQFSGFDRLCCVLGRDKDKYNRNCSSRTDILVRTLKGEYENCSKAFLECCNYAEAKRAPPKKERPTFSITELLESDDDSIAIHTSTSSMPTFPDSVDTVINYSDFSELDLSETPEEEEIFESDLTVRNDFRETWIFEDILIGENNTVEFPEKLPDSITTWVIQAVSVSPMHGICVAEPQKLVTFKKIFLQLNLPYSVVRYEQVEIQATVFNYGAKRIRAVMYMYGAQDLCTGAQPGEKSERKRLVINARSSASASFPVIPLKAKDFDIKVVVLSAEGSDVIMKTLHVVPEGIPKEISIPIKLDPTNQQRRLKRHVHTMYYSDDIDPTTNLQTSSIKLNVPEEFVPGTESCSVTALGDQFGTVIETSVHDPENLLQEPKGCGEQNIMRLAPTLYTIRYLKVTGKLTPAIEQKGYGFIQKGYNNQMRFKKQDGSYSTFPHTKASTWLTAFALKVFCQSNEVFHLDESVLCSGVRWLVNNQEPDGSYTEKTPAIMKDIMGGIQGKTPLTAFILITLKECKCNVENLLVARQKARAYLEKHWKDVDAPLPTAIIAYALALSDSELKKTVNDKLLSMAEVQEDTNTMYWKTADPAQDIQTAAYALLTQLLLDDISRSTSIVNWLNSKQQHSGAFKSTQDTVIGLQSLAEYAIKAQMPPINLVVNISSSNNRNFYKVMEFTEDNALTLQDAKVDKIGGTLFVKTSGHGMGSLSVNCRYNLIVPPEEMKNFDVTVNVSDTRTKDEENLVSVNQAADQAGGKDMVDISAGDLASDEVLGRRRVRREKKLKLRISLCVRYLGKTEAGMSMVDVGIFSGFEPVLHDIQKLQDDPNHLIQRYEKSNRGVVFYLQEVPTETDYCFSFHIVQEYVVGNTQTSVIKVYDYYNPDAVYTTFYSLDSNSPLLQPICEGGVCKCAEVDCPSRNLFSSLSKGYDAEESRKALKKILCDNYDYVWKGQLSDPVRKEGGFLNISFLVKEVIKEGVEKKSNTEGKIRTLLSPEYCDKTSPALVGTTYLILGKNGEEYKNDNGDIWYRYMLDKKSTVYIWSLWADLTAVQLHYDLMHVTRFLSRNGCET